MSKKGGWQKLKDAEQKKKEQDAALKGVPSLLSYFTKKNEDRSSSREKLASTNEQSTQYKSTKTDVLDQLNIIPPSPPDAIGSAHISTCVSSETDHFSNDPGDWDINSKGIIAYWTEKGPHDCQNIDSDFSSTKREYQKQNRYLSKSLFQYVTPTKQIGKREWLIYCLLFSDIHKRGLLCEGFNDWKNASYIHNHAMSEQHISSLFAYHNHRQAAGRVYRCRN